MHKSDRVIDEYTLAAFLAGTLSEERRQEVIEYLAANADAREVLQMAAQALEAAESGDLAPETAGRRPRRPARQASRTPKRPTRPTWFEGASRYVAATVIVFVVGIVLRLTFGPPTDALRAPLQRTGPQLQVEVTSPGPGIEWAAVENAYRYRLVVWDPQEARVVEQYEISRTVLEPSDSVVQDLRRALKPDYFYTLRVDAIDAQNRLLGSSEAVEFAFE